MPVKLNAKLLAFSIYLRIAGGGLVARLCMLSG